MGDPKFSRKRWASPSHPWVGERIKQENLLALKYGLKNKREIWKAQAKLRAWRTQARELQARLQKLEKQAEVERNLLIGKLQRLGMLSEGATLDDILALNIEQILARRFQSQVFLKGLAKSTTHARQLIAHGHLAVAGRKVNVPGYLLARGEEERVSYYGSSPLNNSLHPMRPPADFRGVFPEIRLEEQDDRRGGGGQRRFKVHVPVPVDQVDETVGVATPEEKTKDIIELTPEVPAEEAETKGPEEPKPAESVKPSKGEEKPKHKRKEG